MKLEDFKKATDITERINKYQKRLDELNTCYKKGTLVICLKTATGRDGDTLLTISPNSDSEHEYANQARKLVEHIQKDLLLRIDKLLLELESL